MKRRSDETITVLISLAEPCASQVQTDATCLLSMSDDHEFVRPASVVGITTPSRCFIVSGYETAVTGESLIGPVKLIRGNIGDVLSRFRNSRAIDDE